MLLILLDNMDINVVKVIFVIGIDQKNATLGVS